MGISTLEKWIEVAAQGGPSRIGSFAAGAWFREPRPVCRFLPPALVADEEGHAEFVRAVVIITEATEKGTSRYPQEYSNPLLMLDGKQYATNFTTAFATHCAVIDRQRFSNAWPGWWRSLHFDDGTFRNL